MDVADMDAVMAAMETDAAAEAMAHDGVVPGSGLDEDHERLRCDYASSLGGCLPWPVKSLLPPAITRRLRVQLDRARKAELVRLLERDVEEAEVLELLGAGQGPDVERA